MEEQKTPLNVWAIVELMGHQRIAGKCTERSVAGVNMLQIDVPETESRPAFSRLVGGGAIYAINPVDEETCRLHARRSCETPILSFDGASVIRAEVEKRLKALPTAETAEGPEFGEDDDQY